MRLHIKLFSVAALIISFGLYQAVAPQTNAQVMFKTSAEQPNGGGSQSSSDDSGNDAIYVIGGLAIAAIVGYVLYKKYNKPEEEDSSSTSNASLDNLLQKERGSFVNKVQEVKDKIPVDLFFAIRNQNVTIPDRTYSVGLSFKF